MKRSQVFWGIMLIVVGGLFLLNTMGIMSFDVWGMIWPVFLILLGISIIIGMTNRGRGFRVEQVSIPLEGVEQAQLRVNHGIGRLVIEGEAGPGELLSGNFGGGVNRKVKVEGGIMKARLKMAEQPGFPVFDWFNTPPEWTFALNPNIPIALDFNGGAGETRVDLSRTRVNDLRFDGGMGAIRVTLPAGAGLTRVHMDGGLGELRLYIPEGVAARIKAEVGLGSVTVDQNRFPRTGERTYASPNYDTAENKADITIDGGVGAVIVS